MLKGITTVPWVGSYCQYQFLGFCFGVFVLVPGPVYVYLLPWALIVNATTVPVIIIALIAVQY